MKTNDSEGKRGSEKIVLVTVLLAAIATVAIMCAAFVLMKSVHEISAKDKESNEGPPVFLTTNIIHVSSVVEMPEFLPTNVVNVSSVVEMPEFLPTNVVNVSSVVELPDNMKSVDPQEEERARLDAMAALFAINHINWVVTKITTYNDPAVLEEEYKGLTADALNLRVIKDPELIDLICRILDVIVEMRIEEKERQFLKDELDQGAADALVDAVSGFSLGYSGNPIAMVANAITSVASSALNYKKAKRVLQKKFDKQSWELDKNRLYYLNNLNKDLIRNFWAIVQKYPDLPDEARLSEKNIQLLVDHLKDEDAQKRLEFLQAFEPQFAGFQPYWYHRAAAGYEVWNNKNLDEFVRSAAFYDAKRSNEKFMAIQITCGNIIRRDQTAAKAALLHAAMLSEEGSIDRQAYQDAINVVVANSSPDDWQAAYFCALLAVREPLNDIPQAERILAPVISELDWQRRRRLVDWKDEEETKFDMSSTNTVGALQTVGDALYDCRTLVANLANLSEEEKEKRLAAICDDQNASMREKMFCYGAMSYERFLEKMRPDISRMRVYNENGHYKASVPVSWVIARNCNMGLFPSCYDSRIEFSEQKESEGKRQMDVREDDDNTYIKIDYGEAPTKPVPDFVKILCRFDRDKGKVEDRCFMVEVQFYPDSGNQNVLIPKYAKVGRWNKTSNVTGDSTWQMKRDENGNPTTDEDTGIIIL